MPKENYHHCFYEILNDLECCKDKDLTLSITSRKMTHIKKYKSNVAFEYLNCHKQASYLIEAPLKITDTMDKRKVEHTTAFIIKTFKERMK